MALPAERISRLRNWRLWLGLLAVLCFAGAAAISLFYLPFSLDYPAPAQQFLLPGTLHWLGTDSTGRDLASLVMASSFTSLAVAVAAALVGLLLALPMGFVAAAWPRLLGWMAEASGGVLLVLTPLVAAITGAALFGPHASTVAVVIGLANFGQSARFIRRAARELWRREYAVTARLAGFSSAAIASRHLLPNVMPAVTTFAIGQVASGILWEATLSFLGLGVASPRASFGLMLDDARIDLPGHIWEAVAVGVILTLAVLSFRLLAEGVSRASRSWRPVDGDILAAA